MFTDESVLMDLKALLIEAKQKVPPVLQVLQTGDETMLDIGGASFTANLAHISFSRPAYFSYTAYCIITLCIITCFHMWLYVCLTYFILVFSQGRGAVHFAVVSVIVLQTVLSWRPCKPSRSPTLGGKTTWLIVQWTSKSSSLKGRFSNAINRTEKHF